MNGRAEASLMIAAKKLGRLSFHVVIDPGPPTAADANDYELPYGEGDTLAEALKEAIAHAKTMGRPI